MRVKSRAGLAVAFVALVSAFLCAVGAERASAELTLCPPGEAAGQCSNAEGLSTDFSEGRLYVADSGNNRVDVFNAEGDFLFAFGWGVDSGAAALQTCTTASTCQKGIAGSGPGQLASPAWIAVDNSGGPSHHDVYVSDANHRVQKFGPAGNFLSITIGGTQGTSPGQFEDVRGVGVSSGSGTVYVVDTKRIEDCEGQGTSGVFLKRVQKFSEAGSPLEELKPTDAPCGQVTGFAVDSAGRYWLASTGTGSALRRYGPSGTVAEVGCTVDPGVETKGVGVDASDNLFAAQRESQLAIGVNAVLTELGPSCGYLRRFGYGKIVGSMAGIAVLHSAQGDVFGSEGPSPTGGSGGQRVHYMAIPPSGPIVASTDLVTLANTKTVVRAQINPEGEATSFHFAYVDQKAFEEQGNSFTGPHTKETSVKSLTTPAGGFRVNLAEELLGCASATKQKVEAGECLAPQTEYRWRVVATSAGNPTGAGEGTKEGAPFTTKPPLESELFATAVGTESATLSARVNPLGLATTGFFEYVDGADFQKTGFVGAIRIPDPVPPAGEAELDFGSGESPLKRSVSIGGLEEGTTYHYRLTASDIFLSNVHSEALTFTTYRKLQAESCPGNSPFRTGTAALLPDCRAYEMVSPLDKEGGDIVVLPEVTTERPSVQVQSAASGDRFTYGSYRTFGDSASAPYTSQYLANREATGWSNRAINPPKERGIKPKAIPNNEFRYFSPDLCRSILVTFSEPILATGGQVGYFNIYKDELCGGSPPISAYATITTAKPQDAAPFSLEYQLEPQGISADGSVAIFAANDRLGGTTAPSNTESLTQLYVKQVGVVGGGGPLRYVCVLPGGVAAKACSAGSGTSSLLLGTTRLASVNGALSADGKRVYWTDESPGGGGQLYLRENPLAGGTECSGPTAPCTIAVSGGGSAHFWGAAPDGSAALFVSGGDLDEFTVAGEVTQKIAGQSFGVLGASSDLSRVYFASGEVIEEGGQPLESQSGEEPVAGRPNLYLHEAGPGAGTYRFIGTLGPGDVSPAPGHQNQSSATSQQPAHHNGQVSADGLHAAFMSEAPLTGFDNTDASSGERCDPANGKGICDNEVFLYDAAAHAGEGELICVSCNPSGSRPEGRNVAIPSTPMQVAARLPVFETTLYQPRALSGTGKRLFFESQDPLTPRDSNGRLDVYEWEAAGEGGCTEESATYSAENHGCVDLISSGQSVRDSELADADSNGENVFFTTLSSLLPYDYGLVDMYDARVDGGLPAPPSPAPECEGEACQHPAAAPEFTTPSTSTNEGPGNVVEKPKKKHKKKHPKHKKAAKQKRRAAR